MKVESVRENLSGFERRVIFMKFLNLKAITRISVLALVLAFTGFSPALAQNNNNRNDTGRTEERRTDRTENTRVAEQDNDTDWGWLGLLGLLGLAGLIPKKRSIEVKGVRDVNDNRPVS